MGAQVVRSLLFLLLPGCVLSVHVFVNTTQGVLRGARSNIGDSEYVDTFLGVPFARPPIGSLRFQKPQRPDGWVGVRDATDFASACPQLFSAINWVVVPISEDCLYLNIYTPMQTSDNNPLPVMVWFHGGGFLSGTGMLYNGTKLASKGVVVVTVNYRLDALGFLSTEDSSSPGNYGLLDQIQALQWIKESISAFNGNPNDVTIFGESAGAASVSLLRLSPLARGLFSKAIMESGVSIAPWAILTPTSTIRPLACAQAVATLLECPSEPSSAMIDCLRLQSVEAILNASISVAITHKIFVFIPVVENIFGVVPRPPAELLQEGAGADITSIRGVNKDEIALFLLPIPPTLEVSMSNTMDLINMFMEMYFPGNPTQAALEVTQEYISLASILHEGYLREKFIELLSDYAFVMPTIMETKAVANRTGAAPQYVYQFTYRSSASPLPDWADVPHATDVFYVFGHPFTHDSYMNRLFSMNYTRTDADISDHIMVMWTNLAKHGDPTPQRVAGVDWSVYSMDTQMYLDIGETFSVKTHLRQERVQFWADLEERFGA